MGIYDREYYRREGPSFLGAFGGRGQVCKWLILANVAAFLVQLATQPRGFMVGWGWFSDAFALEPQKVMSGEVWRLLTYAFLHDPSQILHILFNMLFLWWFGREMEEMYGSAEFLAFYLVSAILGGLAFFGWAVSQGVLSTCVGASGAVTAVLVLFALHYPRHRILLWFFIPIPIWLLVVVQVGMDAFVFVGGIRTTTAVTVHLAGAAFGFLYYKGHWRLLRLWQRLGTWQRERSRPPLRVYREEPAKPSIQLDSPTNRDVDDQLEARVDAVLEKVARHGQGSLTEEERQLLVRASEVYKRRRT